MYLEQVEMTKDALLLCESLDGTMPPFQLIYKGKTERSLPTYDFLQGFSLSFNEKLFD